MQNNIFNDLIFTADYGIAPYQSQPAHYVPSPALSPQWWPDQYTDMGGRLSPLWKGQGLLQDPPPHLTDIDNMTYTPRPQSGMPESKAHLQGLHHYQQVPWRTTPTDDLQNMHSPFESMDSFFVDQPMGYEQHGMDALYDMAQGSPPAANQIPPLGHSPNASSGPVTPQNNSIIIQRLPPGIPSPIFPVQSYRDPWDPVTVPQTVFNPASLAHPSQSPPLAPWEGQVDLTACMAQVDITQEQQCWNPSAPSSVQPTPTPPSGPSAALTSLTGSSNVDDGEWLPNNPDSKFKSKSIYKAGRDKSKAFNRRQRSHSLTPTVSKKTISQPPSITKKPKRTEPRLFQITPEEYANLPKVALARNGKWQCPVTGCRRIVTKGRKPDCERHQRAHCRADPANHYHGSFCCGYPKDSPEGQEILRLDPFATVEMFRDIPHVGGCLESFARDDARQRHLRGPNCPCRGDMRYLYSESTIFFS
jgi:hypothetical protein